MQRMFLIDGSNHAFRVHFALPPMHGVGGFPTSALYGFTTMLARLMRQWEPDYVVVSFDVGRTFRHDLYAPYKGHRPDMPEDLRAQWPELPGLVEAFGLRAISVDGYEADDVLGTLAKKYAGPDMEVFLVTGDKDFLQLVDEHIHVLDLMKDRELGPEDVVEKFGVEADRVIDALGLAGDSSDNIPGVPGIGVKTAAKLLHQYGTLEAVLEAAPTIKGKRGENLRNFADDARLSKALATIALDVPIPGDLQYLAPRGLQEDELRPRFERWDFNRVARKLLKTEPAVDINVFQTVDTADGVRELVGTLRAAGRFAFDTETTSLNPRSAALVGMSFSTGKEHAVYVPIAHKEGQNVPLDVVLELLGPVLQDQSVGKVGQNLKYDLVVCRNHGIDLQGIVGDTLLLDYVFEAHVRSRKLDNLADRHLGHTMTPFEEVSKGETLTFDEVPIDEATEYAAEDAVVAYLLHDKLSSRIEQAQAFVYEQIELPLMPVLADMETLGILLDTARLGEVRDDVAGRLALAEQLCHDIVGRPFKVGSVKELRVILFEELGYEPIKKTKSGYSTDSSVLEKLAGMREPCLPTAILHWRQLQKLFSTYLDKLPGYVEDDGRIHTSFNQAVAATGRLSSVDPNLQNIPIRTHEGRRIREAFVPAPGHVFLSADYSQVELRVLAHFCKSDTLRRAFKAGEDIHRRTASEVFSVSLDEVTSELRSAAKAINFGLLYGMSAFRLAGDLQISRAEAAQYMDDYFARMPEVETWIEATKESARKLGYVTTLYGRRRVLPAIGAKNYSHRMAAEREAVNTVIQGTAADIIKLAMLRVQRRLTEEGRAARLLLQVHDELLLEVPQAEVEAVTALVRTEMERAADLAVPLSVNTATGHNWNEAHG